MFSTDVALEDDARQGKEVESISGARTNGNLRAAAGQRSTGFSEKGDMGYRGDGGDFLRGSDRDARSAKKAKGGGEISEQFDSTLFCLFVHSLLRVWRLSPFSCEPVFADRHLLGPLRIPISPFSGFSLLWIPTRRLLSTLFALPR